MQNLEERISLIRDKRKEISKLENDIHKVSTNLFDDFCKSIFQKYTKLESFGWSQYTPYFNDGDICVFTANTDYLKINGEFAEESKWYNVNSIKDWGKWNPKLKKYVGRVETVNESYDEVLAKATDEIRDFLSLFDNDFFLRKFGDHADVTINSSGFSVDECEHD